MANEDKYVSHDEFLSLHLDDPSLRPMVFSLPEPPELKLVAGYGKAIADQRFEKMTIPPRLLYLEREALRILKEENTKANFTVTPYKIQKKFWELFEQNEKKYKPEIAFIKKIWWHRLHGYWFYNRGKPTYITGWHFMFLNFWHMADVPGGHPDYRDRDRKEFLFFDYTYKTKETFAKLDAKGYGVVNEDGSYDMVELPNRTSYGCVQSKNRRSGNTNKGFNCCDEIATRTVGMDVALGTMSYTSKNAGSLFKDKLVKSYFVKPLWMSPFTTSLRNTQETIHLDVVSSDYDYKGLKTLMDYASTASPKYYDSKKMAAAMMEEEGKTDEVNISERWGVVKLCLSQGNGKIIHGWSYHPSTVEETSSNSADFKFLIASSDFYRRIKSSGQTYSGLDKLFVPGDEALDGYIDSYGYSVKGEILDYQKKEGFTQTSTEFLLDQRESYLREGDMEKYRGEKKRFPLKFADSWLGDSGSIGFDIEKIDKRMEQLSRHKEWVKGNFEWVNGTFGGDVYWVHDEENGRFEMALNPPEAYRNKKVQVEMYSVFKGAVVPMYRPARPDVFVLGADPFGFSNKQQAMAKKKKIGSSSRASDGGLAVWWKYDEELDGGKPAEEWESAKFILSYRHRVELHEYNEDALKAAIYCGAMVYPETNKETTYQYFIEHGFGGYLLYDVDIMTGKPKDKPGVFSLQASKNTLFTLIKEHIALRSSREPFDLFLQECKDINGMEEMTMYDRLTAHGLALMGARSTYPTMFGDNDVYNKSTDMDSFIESFWT